MVGDVAVVDGMVFGADVDAAREFIFLLGSFCGRNKEGVWYTLGALEGGLKMIWSCVSVLDGRKEGSGFTRSALRVRRYVDC